MTHLTNRFNRSIQNIPFPKNNFRAIMDATMSYVTINTDLPGEMTMVEHAFEPEIDHTAYGVLSDLFRILTDFYGTALR